MAEKGFELFNPVEPLLSVVLYLGELTHDEAMEASGLGVKPFKSLLSQGVPPKRIHVAKLACLLGLDARTWLQLVAELDAAAAVAGGGQPELEAFPQLCARVVQQARRHFGAELVDERLLRLKLKEGRDLDLALPPDPPANVPASTDWVVDVAQQPNELEAPVRELGPPEHLGADTSENLADLEQTLAAVAESLRLAQAGIGRLATLIQSLKPR